MEKVMESSNEQTTPACNKDDLHKINFYEKQRKKNRNKKTIYFKIRKKGKSKNSNKKHN